MSNMPATIHPTEKHPNEVLGIDVDAPRPILQSDAPVARGNYGKMKCYNLSTGDFVGWLASYNNNVYLTQDESAAASVKWLSYKEHTYLEKETSPNDRYLGLGWNGYATWGLTGGWNDPIVYNADHTISLKTDPKRKLYGPYGNQWVAWSGGEDNQNILRCELEM